MSRAHWIPGLLAKVRDGWTVHGIEFPPEDVRACWMPNRRGKPQFRPAQCRPNPLHLKPDNAGIRTPSDPTVKPIGPRRPRATAAEVEARRVRLLEQAAKMAQPGEPLSARAVARACGLPDMVGENDRIALLQQGRWPYTTTQPGAGIPRFGSQAYHAWVAEQRAKREA
jgi:hypothetical protein